MEPAAQPHVDELYTEELYRLPPKVTVAIEVPWREISDDNRTLLAKILDSIRLPIAAVRIVTVSVIDEEWVAAANAREIIAFGCKTRPELNGYMWSTIAGSAVLRCDALDVLDDTRKKSLWKALKEKYHG